MEETTGFADSPKILLGSGRSGTTWIQDCLADANELTAIFEPLHPAESKIGLRCAYDVLTRGSRDEELEHLFNNADSGVVAKRWSIHRTPRGLIYPKLSRLTDMEFSRRCIRAWRTYSASIIRNRHKLERQGFLIKCIRANLMVDWLANCLNYTVAMIIRHPCAVVESKYRLGKFWDPRGVIDRYRVNSKLHALTDGRYETLLASNLSTTEALCLNWVIENQWPAENSRHGGYTITFYENLLAESKEGWEKLCLAMGLPNVPSENLTRKPSQQSSIKTPIARIDSSSPIWKRNLDKAQLDEIQGILDKTECHLYSVGNVCPL